MQITRKAIVGGTVLMTCCVSWADDLRVWKSTSGNHEIKAELIEVSDDTVTLRAAEGGAGQAERGRSGLRGSLG